MSIDSSWPPPRQPPDERLRDGSLGARSASTPLLAGWRGDAACALLVAIAYFAGTRIGFALTPGDMPISMFWPPNAILLAALVLVPARRWWMILLALVPAHFLAQFNNGVPIATSFGWLLGNAGEALLGATLLSRVVGRRLLFHSLHGVSWFLLCAFILAPLLTSFLDAAIVVGTNWGRNYWLLWTTRSLSNMLAQLTIVPVIVVAGTGGLSSIARWPPRARGEAALLGAGIAIVGLVIFRADTLGAGVPALICLPLPLLLWASIRFGPAGLSASLLTVAVVAFHGVMHGRGPFIAESIPSSVLSMQLFLCVTGVPLLILAAATVEGRRAEQALRDMSVRLIDAQERERRHIAQELHDGIGQTLALAEVELDRMIAEAPRQASHTLLRRVRDRMTMVSQGLWEISHGLYPSNLEFLGLGLALSRLCGDLGEETALELQYHEDSVPDRLPDDVSLCIFRVAQEALQNIVRHSQARNAFVSLRADGERLWLRIQDDGVGFSQRAPGAGLGFASIRERLKAMDGDVEIRSAPGEGTRLEAWVALRPVPRREAAPAVHALN